MHLVLVLAVLLAAAPAARAKGITVHSGDSIQAAVAAAAPGDNILVEPGTYSEPGHPCTFDSSKVCAVTVGTDRVRLTGLSRRGAVTLTASGTQDTGIEFAQGPLASCQNTPGQLIERSQLRGFTVTGFQGSAVIVVCGDKFRLTDDHVTGTSSSTSRGIASRKSSRGRISHSVVSGAFTDIIIVDSERIRADRNQVTDAVGGIEINNSTDSRADHNEVTANSQGIVVDSAANGTIVDLNTVHDNNRPNATAPVGFGIVVAGADGTLVRFNTVTGNHHAGIFVLSQGSPPDDNRVVVNTATGNGTSPDPKFPGFPAGDLTWDGTGTGNCWGGNVNGTQSPAVLPACP